ncbi:ABC transporter substrate-binding protein [Streptacidiphilus sp. P02-A3a]|uniref:ABC transporter substrate-binding protein n=1 Tax=Streptacidiphilus sp. P02-A3a TaxID=2704468 RepID=UPI0015FCFF17|nr:ABC transporter substrate-binding protein [Streptacidiphilus sp. P02-A3a]QMU71286.1 ABC transporter substrate-binding protein [Streptacidiphilus sp. P02-A3a]
MNLRPKPAGLLAGATAVTALIALSGCGGSASGGGSSSSASGPHGTLTLATGATGSFADDFNPFSPNVEAPTNGMIYEPLFFFNTAKAGDVQSWLGTSYAWSNGGRTLTVNLRHGVTWSDGQPFTSADVAFSFNQKIQNKALNSYGLPLAGATTNGDYQAIITFTQSQVTNGYLILGKSFILPKHIWSTVSDPTTWQNTRPVGTGAFEVQSVSGQVMTLTANTHYYMPGFPKVKTLKYLAFSGNNGTDAAVESGEVDWGGGFIPDIQTTYLDKNKNYVLSNVPLADTFLLPNTRSGPTTDLALRQAISEAMDRDFISKSVYNGETTPTNPEALLSPNFDSVADPALANASFDEGPANAKATLGKAGYKLGSDGMFSLPDGQPLNLTVQYVSGYTDYESILQIVQQELAEAGIRITIAAPSYAQYTTNQDDGDFQLLLTNAGYTPSPYSYYYNLLDSAVAPAIGTADTVGNFGRYANPAVDAALTRIAGTSDTAVQDQAFATVEQAVADDLPIIPLFQAQDEIEINGDNVTGYPTAADPYAATPLWLQPDDAWVAMRIATK